MRSHVPVGRMTSLLAVTTLLVVTPRTRAALAAVAVALWEVPRVGPVGAGGSWCGRIPVGSACPRAARRVPVGPEGRVPVGPDVVVAGAAGTAPVRTAVPVFEVSRPASLKG
jgi:hypothetical protein